MTDWCEYNRVDAIKAVRHDFRPDFGCPVLPIQPQRDHQDKILCTICNRPLLHVPGLGEWIMHPVCQANVEAHVKEAAARATRVERERIYALLRKEVDMP